MRCTIVAMVPNYSSSVFSNFVQIKKRPHFQFAPIDVCHGTKLFLKVRSCQILLK